MSKKLQNWDQSEAERLAKEWDNEHDDSSESHFQGEEPITHANGDIECACGCGKIVSAEEIQARENELSTQELHVKIIETRGGLATAVKLPNNDRDSIMFTLSIIESIAQRSKTSFKQVMDDIEHQHNDGVLGGLFMEEFDENDL